MYIIIYGLSPFIALFLVNYSNKNEDVINPTSVKYLFTISAIFLLSFVRDINFTHDFRWYYDFYNYYYENGSRLPGFKANEILWEKLNEIAAVLRLPPLVFFSILSSITVFLFIEGMSYFNVNRWFIFLVFILTGTYFWTLSGLRQALAIGIVYYSFRFLVKRQLVYYVASIVLAAGFHISAIIAIPLYSMYGLNYHRIKLLSVYALSIVTSYISFASDILNASILNIMQLLPLFDKYAFSYSDALVAEEHRTSSGLGVIIFQLINLLLIFEARPTSKSQIFILNFYFIFEILSNLFPSIGAINRIVIYGSFILPIVISIVIENNNKFSRGVYHLLFICAFAILFFISLNSFITPLHS
ncbi:EpsG family protein [Vibrio breoganii]